MFLRVPLIHAEVPTVPLVFTWRVRYNTSFPLPASLWDLAPDFFFNLDNGRVCVILYLPMCDKLDTCFHLTNQCRRIFSTPSLLPEPIFQRRCDACQSTPPLFSFAAEPQLAQASLPTTSRNLISSASRASSSRHLDQNISCPRLLVLQEPKCATVAILGPNRGSHAQRQPANPLTCLHV